LVVYNQYSTQQGDQNEIDAIGVGATDDGR
jgi:hypothetical protein